MHYQNILNNWQKCLKIELLIFTFITVITYFLNHQLLNWFQQFLFITLLILLLANYLIKHSNPQLDFFNLFFLPIIFCNSLSNLTNLLIKNYPALNTVTGILFIILSILLIIPIIETSGTNITNSILRLIISTIVPYVATNSLFIDGHITNNIVDWYIYYGLYPTFISIFFYLLFKDWHYSRFNLKLTKTNNFQIIFISCLILFTLWFICFNQFIFVAPTFYQAVYAWHDFFSSLILNFTSLGEAIRSSISEELIRCAELLILLTLFKKNKYQLEVSIIGSALIFGLAHYTNLITDNLANVTQQAVLAFGFGIYLNCIYLYTNKIWLVMIFHFLANFLHAALYKNPLTMITSPWYNAYSSPLILTIGILLLIELIILILMLTGKRRKFIQENVLRLIQ